MNLHFVDWCVVVGFFVFVTAVATYTRRYTKSVADFLVANRCAGRYLLTISGDMANLGAISLVGGFQLYYQAGFSVTWWQAMIMPVGIIIALSGFVIYRFRQSRVLTLAEFAERRYGRKFRIFMGFIMFISGALNFGIFPAVGSRFFIHFCGFPESFLLGPVSVSTYPVVMAVLLIVSLYFTYMGGQIAVLLTDFIQAFFYYIVLLIVTFFVLFTVGWGRMEEVLLRPENIHMIHPFRGDSIPDFNFWYFVMLMVLSFYGTRAWQGSQGYNSSALNPHEAKMGGIVAQLRNMAGASMSLIIPIAAYTIMRHHDFSLLASETNATLNTIIDEEVRSQMTIPVVMSNLLLIGMMGGFAAVFLAAFISTHDTYLHSWGSIFIQDVVMPFRKKPFSEKQHMHLLRLSILGVAVFVFIFSLIWPQKEAILLWFQITGAIYLGGAGAVVIGGLYWKKGTTKGAYSAMIAGSGLGVTGVIIQQIFPKFFLNGMEMSFIIAVISCVLYVVISLLDSKSGDYNLDKLLHRGKYAVADDVVDGGCQVKGIWQKLGLTKEFNKRDKFLFFSVLAFAVFWFSIFLAGIIYHFIFDTSAVFWMRYWRYYIFYSVIMVVVMTTWLCVGGLIDVKKMFTRLKNFKRDEHDDGWVQNNNDN